MRMLCTYITISFLLFQAVFPHRELTFLRENSALDVVDLYDIAHDAPAPAANILHILCAVNAEWPAPGGDIQTFLVDPGYGNIVRFDAACTENGSVRPGCIEIQLVFLPEKRKVWPDGQNDRNIFCEHGIDLIKEFAAAYAPGCTEGELIAVEEAIETARKHDPVDAEFRDNGEKSPRKLKRELIVLMGIDDAVLGRLRKEIASAVRMKAAQIEQQIKRGDHAAADLAHILRRGGHLVAAERSPQAVIYRYIVVAYLMHSAASFR